MGGSWDLLVSQSSQVVSSRVIRKACLKTKVKNSWKHPTSTSGLSECMYTRAYKQKENEMLMV